MARGKKLPLGHFNSFSDRNVYSEGSSRECFLAAVTKENFANLSHEFRNASGILTLVYSSKKIFLDHHQSSRSPTEMPYAYQKNTKCNNESWEIRKCGLLFIPYYLGTLVECIIFNLHPSAVLIANALSSHCPFPTKVSARTNSA